MMVWGFRAYRGGNAHEVGKLLPKAGVPRGEGVIRGWCNRQVRAMR
jgi:hypothetical protein